MLTAAPAAPTTACAPSVQALWLDGFLRARGVPTGWGYTSAPSQRALAAWRAGHATTSRIRVLAHPAGCSGWILDEQGETIAACSACSPDTGAPAVAS